MAMSFPSRGLLLVPLASVACLTAVHAATPPKGHLYVSEARADTLVATPAEVFPAAEKALTDDRWVLAPDTEPHKIVTQWKEFRHPLARLVMGNLHARCVVDIQALDETRTVVRFRSGLASERDLESNPAFGLAQSTFRSAVDDFYRDLAAGIEERRSAQPR